MRCNKHRGRRQPEMGSTGLPKHVLNELETFSFQRTFIQSPKSSCDLVEFSEIIRLQRSTFNFHHYLVLIPYEWREVHRSIFFINSASGLTNFIAAGVGNYQRHVNHRRVDLSTV